MNKVSLKEHLASKWFVYLIWLLVVILFWSWIFGLIARPESDEKLIVFIGAYYANTAELSSRFNQQNPDYVKQTDVLYFDLTEYNFDMFLMIRGVESDIIILSKSAIENANLAMFLSLDETVISQLFGDNLQLLTINGKCCGIKLYDKTLKQGKLDDCIGYESANTDDFYLLFNYESLHAGVLNGAQLDGAITLARYILS